MKIALNFKELRQNVQLHFEEVKNISDGGFERGYNEGYTKGNEDGYTNGFGTGVEAGKVEGYSNGYDAGTKDGYNTGYERGSEEGYSNGYDKGSMDGYTAGEEAGRNAENVEFWSIFQDNGNRTDYASAFRWHFFSPTNFKPVFDIKPTTAGYMFHNFGANSNDEPMDMSEYAEKHNIVFDFSNCTNFHTAFASGKIKRLPTIDISKLTDSYYANYAFYGGYTSPKLTTIDGLVCSEKTVFSSSMFSYRHNLTKVIFKGVIAKNGLSLSGTSLDHDSLISMINCLKDYSEDTSGTVWKVTLGSTLLAKLTDEEKQIAEDKGWQLV